MDRETDQIYMKIALEEALKGYGQVSPNPLVGAVIVKNGKIIGRGAHLKYGQNHAEVNAFANCTESPVGADIYVTLEPCDHYGKTPPCSLKIIESGIKRVIIGTTDHNCLVNGNGIKRLKNAGIEVEIGVLEDECYQLNRAFFHYCQTGKPLVTLKMAVSSDGCLAAQSGKREWISSVESRELVHHLRAGMDGVMVGRKTAENDDPKLDARLVGGRAPYRIVLDSKLSLSSTLNLFSDELAHKTILFTHHHSSLASIEKLREQGVQVELVGNDQAGNLDLVEVINRLGELHLTSLLVEGGSELASGLIKNKLADRLMLFMAPIILGSNYGLKDLGIDSVETAIKLSNRKVELCGTDLVIHADFDYKDYQTKDQHHA